MRAVTRFAASFLLVFGELAFGGMLAMAVPPFFRIERGFYKSSASIYLGAGFITMAGLALLAIRERPSTHPGAIVLWISAGLWMVFCIACAIYLSTLWSEKAELRARSFTATLAAGLVAVACNAIVLEPQSFGVAASFAYALTAVTSSVVLGFVSGGMLFGHWYLIDPNLPVDYLRDLVRLTAIAVGVDVIALLSAVAIMAISGGPPALAVASLFDSHAVLLCARIIFGPAATAALIWMCWRTLKIPQTMAATGLLYIAVLSVLVGEMLGRFIMFRTGLPL